ncbi:MAG: zinc ribbon domain-containing protein, partial [Conexivisphaera sp.]
MEMERLYTLKEAKRLLGVTTRTIQRWDKDGKIRVSMGGGAVEVDPYLTSRTCSRCGWVNRDLRGAVFECKVCGLRIDRQLNAAVNIYMRMEGVPRDVAWWDAIVLPALVGGYVLTGAERKVPDEPGRGLYDAVKPKLYVAYDRYEDAYLP